MQTPEENAEFARRRREEKRQSEIKAARQDAIITALDGINPYTGKKISSSADVDEFLLMKKLHSDSKMQNENTENLTSDVAANDD